MIYIRIKTELGTSVGAYKNVMFAFFDDEGEYGDILFDEKLDYRDKRKYSF